MIVDPEESHELDNGKTKATFRIKLFKKEAWLNVIKQETFEVGGESKLLVEFETRGMDVLAVDIQTLSITMSDGSVVDDVDISEGDW